MSNRIDFGFVNGLTKGIPAGTPDIALSDIGKQGWNVLNGDVPLPAAVLLESALAHNSSWMQRYIDGSGVLFAPHGKTTMCPELFHRQIKDGAWGIKMRSSFL
jgi:D-serine dehydratase